MHYILLYSLMEVFAFFKSNSKFIFDIKWTPFQWWLYTGLITHYIGLTAWWGLVESHSIWKATIMCIFLHCLVSFSLKAYYFGPPTKNTILALILAFAALIIGSSNN